MSKPGLRSLSRQVLHCTRCPELNAYCKTVGIHKRKAFADRVYHAKPVPGFGDPNARVWIIGLAPAAHGANRTGRMFTGDRSGDFLYAALHRNGFANQAQAVAIDDGLELRDLYISAALRCAPPTNKPTAIQLERCKGYLVHEYQALSHLKVILTLGAVAWNAALQLAVDVEGAIPKPKPKFAHGAEIHPGPFFLIGCYHVSQQNTFTGRLTPAMLDQVLSRIRTRIQSA